MKKMICFLRNLGAGVIRFSGVCMNRIGLFAVWCVVFTVAGIGEPAVFRTLETTASDGEWNITELDVARNVSYMSSIEKDVILEMNKVRTNPGRYVEMYIEPILKYYNGNRYERPGQVTIVTFEGKDAVEECIRVLKSATGVGVLRPLQGLALAAQGHRNDQGATELTGHTGTDGSSMQSRIDRYCASAGARSMAENISYGNDTALEIVLQLLIDDGVASRGHRTNMMNGNYTQVGVGFGSHGKYEYMCVINYANNCIDK